jgi:hypothetical protein
MAPSAGFTHNDLILVPGDGSVDGFYTVTAIDGGNQGFRCRATLARGSQARAHARSVGPSRFALSGRLPGGVADRADRPSEKSPQSSPGSPGRDWLSGHSGASALCALGGGEAALQLQYERRRSREIVLGISQRVQHIERQHPPDARPQRIIRIDTAEQDILAS